MKWSLDIARQLKLMEQLWAWGYNGYGNLGLNDKANAFITNSNTWY